jgi:hypothetical protein
MINRQAMVNWRFYDKYRISLLLGMVLVVLAACSYKGGENQPVIRKFTWFSYIAGEDIARQCTGSRGERYRLVYNGVYNEQVRSYDITPAERGRYQIKINVTEEADIRSFSLDLNNPDLFHPWRPKVSTTNISASNLGVLKKTLKNAGFFDSPPPSENLPSIGFYWVISACIDGKFSQNAFLWPDNKFKQAQFGKLLSAWDFTDIPVNLPRKTSNFGVYGTNDTTEYRNHFNLRFGSNGFLRHTTVN